MPRPTAAPEISSDTLQGIPGAKRLYPAYPTVCIPPPPLDLNCKDIPYRNFLMGRTRTPQAMPPDVGELIHQTNASPERWRAYRTHGLKSSPNQTR